VQELRDGRYVVVRVLGEGAQASTFEAVDKLEGRLVAIKRFALRVAKQWKDVELAEREARVLASLSHPRLPAYVEHFEEGGALYLVMERIEGVSLSDYVKKGGTWREDDVVGLLEQASVVLGYLHSRSPPIIHRDLKPGNVIRKPDGSFAFVDFGAVRDRLRPEGGSTVVGTFGYMAPEQFQGRAVPASDVYAVGATALWMLTGYQPEDLPHKGLAIDVPAALGPRAKPMLVTMLSSMLEPDPDKRPQSIAPLLAGFEPPRPRPAPTAASSPPGPASPAAAESPSPEEIIEKGTSFFRRFLVLFWVAAAFAWWILPFRSALGFTVGLALLSYVTRHLVPPGGQRTRRRIPRYERPPAERIPVVRIAEAEDAPHARVAPQEGASHVEEEETPQKRAAERSR
jgi:serine/threonine protein kinase